MIRNVYYMNMDGQRELLAADKALAFEILEGLSEEDLATRIQRARTSGDALAPLMDRVFVLEPSLGPAGLLKTARKAIGRFTVTVKLLPSAILPLMTPLKASFCLDSVESPRSSTDLTAACQVLSIGAS